MKLKGTFTIREVAGEILAIPVGRTALELNGMIILNPVSQVIWKQLEMGTSLQALVGAVTDLFQVDPQEAEADIVEFLAELRKQDLLDEM